MNGLTPGLLSKAADLLVQERRASVSLLQRHFRLGYSDALLLMVQLAGAGVVEEPNPAGRYHLALNRLHICVEKQAADVVHIRILHDLALYLLENHGYESTQCVTILTAPYTYNRNELREVVRGVLATEPSNLLFSTMLALAELPQMAERFPVNGIRQAIEEASADTTPQLGRIENTVLARHAGLVHAVRYLERRIMDDIDPHSRAVDEFIHTNLLPQGEALDVSVRHGEHVIPCVFIQKKAMQLLRHGIPVDEVADWIEPYVRVVWIDKADASQLDGPEGLKVVMPAGWRFGHDCIYARLHHMEIRFTPPSEGPECACTTGNSRFRIDFDASAMTPNPF